MLGTQFGCRVAAQRLTTGQRTGLILGLGPLLLLVVLLGCGTTQRGGVRGKAHVTKDSGTDSAVADASVDAGPAHCTASSCDANATCDDGSGKIVCTCKPHFDGDGKSCTDIDECKNDANVCGKNATCVNTEGSYRCECDALFAMNGNSQCTDLCDMAKQDPNVCGSNARCAIHKQGALCTECLAGFIGDGQNCTDHRADCPAECNGGAKSDANAVCVQAGSKYSCKCADGYGGNPGSCANIDECKDKSDDCDAAKSTCTDTEGGFYCACNSGYSGDGGNCKDINECKDKSLFSCPKNATCVNDVGSYHCGCAAPFTGDDPQSCYCNLTGYWAMRQDVTTCWADRTQSNTTFISPGVLRATVWELHKYSYDGSTITVEKMGCGSDIVPDFVSPLFDESYASFVPDKVYTDLGMGKGKDIPVAGIVPGSMFSTPAEGAVDGIKLDGDPETAPWPATGAAVNAPGSSTLPAWVDTEKDGEPGTTLWPRVPSDHTLPCVGTCPAHYSYLPTSFSGNPLTIATRASCVSVATRVITKMDADVKDCGKITGDVINLKTEGRVHSCITVAKADWGKDMTCRKADWDAAKASSNSCDSTPFDGQDQSQNSKASFDLVKIGELADSVDCAAVRAALPAIDHGPPTDTCPF
jgi:hypothetical protein